MLRFSVDQGVFASALSSVVGASAKKSTMPILTTVRLAVDDLSGRKPALDLACTDLDLALQARVDVQDADFGGVCVDARHLLQVVSALPAMEVTFEVTDINFVKVTCGKSKFNLPGMSAEEFPKLPQVKDATDVRFDLRDFAAALSAAAPYCSTDETRYVLNGVLFDPRGCFVATDGHRLVKAPCGGDKPKNTMPRQIIVPSKACQHILRGLADPGDLDEVTLSFGESHLLVSFNKVNLTTRLIDGRFPDFEQVIPGADTARNEITCGLEYLAGVVKRVSLVLEGRSDMLRIENGVLSCQSPDRGEASEELLNVLDGGESIRVVGDSKIGVSAHYLKGALDTLKGSDVVTLAWADDMSPMTVTADGSTVLAVIMPMRI